MTTDGTGLVAFFRCHDCLFGIESERIDRLVLPTEAAPRGNGTIEVAGRLYAAWDLGEAVGLAPIGAEAVWVLLSVAGAESATALALRTGPCLGIRAGARAAVLPPSLFTGRRGAFPRVLSGAAVDEVCGPESVALLIDPARLLSASEIAASRERLLRSAP